jgi:hypothetical protein
MGFQLVTCVCTCCVEGNDWYWTFSWIQHKVLVYITLFRFFKWWPVNHVLLYLDHYTNMEFSSEDVCVYVLWLVMTFSYTQHKLFLYITLFRFLKWWPVCVRGVYSGVTGNAHFRGHSINFFYTLQYFGSSSGDVCVCVYVVCTRHWWLELGI